MDDIKQRVIHILRNKVEETSYLIKIAKYNEEGKEITEYKLKDSKNRICLTKTLYNINGLFEVEVFSDENVILKFTYDINGEESISNDLIYQKGDWEYDFY